MSNAVVIVPDTFKINRKELINAKDSSNDENHQQKFRAIVLKWCMQNKMVICKEGKWIPNIEKNDAVLENTVLATNFSSLPYEDNLQTLINVLEDTEVDTRGARVSALRIQVVTYVDSEFINRYVNKFLHALCQDPFSPFTGDTLKEWWVDLVYVTYPSIWVLYAIQVEMQALMSEMY
jgi:hypothetical protein